MLWVFFLCVTVALKRMEVENMHVELEMLGEAFAVSGIKTSIK